MLGLIEGVAARARIAGFDMVEFTPARHIDGQGSMVAAQLLPGALAVISRQA